MNESTRPESSGRREIICVAALVLIFASFTWRGVTMFFSDDDMMNMYQAWVTPSLKIWKAQALPWMPLYRPLGTAVYRLFYEWFGFYPLPLYVFGWLLLIANVFVAWRFFRVVSASVFEALLGLSLILVHGCLQDLYMSAGTIYDRLCFLFTLLAVIAYARARRAGGGLSAGNIALLCLLSLMAMNSKESGATVPVTLFCYECVFYLPAAWREKRVREWARSIVPLYGILATLLSLFVFGRVRGTAALSANPAYQPHWRPDIWLTHVARYLDMLVYDHVHLTPVTAALALIGMACVALLLRNRAMLFGCLFFMVAITPVATVADRPGYVLYVPGVGLGLCLAALIAEAIRRIPARSHSEAWGDLSSARLAALVTLTALVTWVHAKHWPAAEDIHASSEWRLTEAFRREYPALKPGAKIFFVRNFTTANPYDILFNLRLLYHDPLIEVSRLDGTQDQKPGRQKFDYVFTTAAATYVELDGRNPEESMQLNLLKDFSPGRFFDTARRDSIGYPVSGITASDLGTGWWTTQAATLKFDVYPAEATLSLKFWVPHDEARTSDSLSVAANGQTLGSLRLNRAGMNTVTLPVPPNAISRFGYTLLALNASDLRGVALFQAGFEYVR